MVVNVRPVNVRGNYKSVVALRPSHRRFVSDPVCFLRRYLAGFEGLPDLVSDDIPLILKAVNVQIFSFGKKKLLVAALRIAFVGADVFAVLGLFLILRIVGPVLQAGTSRWSCPNSHVVRSVLLLPCCLLSLA